LESAELHTINSSRWYAGSSWTS